MKPLNVLLIAGGGYALYWWLTHQTPAAPPATTTGGGSTAGTTAGTGSTTTTNTGTNTGGAVAPAFNSLDAIYQRTAARVSAAYGSAPQSADTFNYFLQMELPAGLTAPDPCLEFGASCGRDPASPMTFANYWGVTAPYLRAHMGLSGLGFYGGLAGLGFASRAVQ
jgi:hypothetical protein